MLDHWPYIHGRSIVDGLSLRDLDIPDMLNVMHYYFEDDHNMANSEEAEAKSSIRTSIYRMLYNTEYKYKYKSKHSTSGYNYSTETANGEPVLDGFVGQDVEDKPDKGPTKPFVPTTDFNPDSSLPFGKTLDPPLK